MAIHDGYGRRTPYEMLLPDEEWPERHFPGIEAEALQRGSDLWNPAAFVMLGATAGALEEIRPEATPTESIHDHGIILFHGYHLWKVGMPTVLVTASTLGRLLGPEPLAESQDLAKGFSGTAGYVQLPQHLVWLQATEEEGPESVDGLFWAGSPSEVLHVALAAGIRSGRPGLGVVPVPAQPFSALADWATGPAREGGEDFATDLPGAAIDGLLGLQTPAEVMKMATLILSEALGGTGTNVNEAQGDEAPEASGPKTSDDGPEPTRLPFTRI